MILGKFATSELCKLHQQTLARLPPTTVRERLRAILECDVTAALANVHVPALDDLLPTGVETQVEIAEYSTRLADRDHQSTSTVWIVDSLYASTRAWPRSPETPRFDVQK
jgi:hypothetical protein